MRSTTRDQHASAARMQPRNAPTPALPSQATQGGHGVASMTDYILSLQRTIGNRATNQLLRQWRLDRAAATPRPRGAAEANSDAPLNAGHTPSRGQVTRGPEGTAIQRKLALAPDRFKNLISTTATLDNSTFVQIRDKYAEYLKMDQPADEVLAMRRMQVLIKAWEGKNGSSRKANDLTKQQLLRDLDAAIQAELPQAITKAHKWHLTRTIGLPAAYLDTWKDADVDTLGKASQALGRGDVPAADQHLTLLRASIGAAVNLIKSALLGHHIGKVDPEMAKAMGDPEYKLGKHDHHRAITHIGDLATARGKSADAGELGAFGAVYKGMAGAALDRQMKAKSKKIRGLDTAEATAILGYSTPLFGEYNNPLRSDLGTKKFDENKQALTKATISGLNKLKPLKATLFRHNGIFPGYKELNQPGATVSDMGFMSSTKSHFVAGTAGKQHQVLEIIESKTGKDVSEVSTFPHEMEVLFKPGTRFQITKRFDKNALNSTWNPALDPEATKYLAADAKKDELEIIMFKKEV